MPDCTELFSSFQQNVKEIDELNAEIDDIEKQLDKLSAEDIFLEYPPNAKLLEQLEERYLREFKLMMDHVGIYHDLLERLEEADEFTRRRLTTEANKIVKATVMEI